MGKIKFEVDENMPDGELLLRFPKGQEHKNIRIINLEAVSHKTRKK